LAFKRGGYRTIEDKERIIDFVKLAQSYGVKTTTACMCVGISEKSFYRWKNLSKDDKREGPNLVHNKLSEEEIEKVVNIMCSEEFRDLPPFQIVPKLLDQGTYVCSESTMHRILKNKNLNARRSKTKCHNKKNRIKPVIIASAPNEVWSWDITFLITNINGRYFYLYLAIDIFSRFIVAGKVYERESGENASEFIEMAALSQNLKKADVKLHSDNGSPMRSASLRIKLEDLGIIPSFSRPSVSNDNPYSESLFRTLKYMPKYPSKNGFKTIDEANLWVNSFIHWYNYQHQHSGIKFCTPYQRHNRLDIEILRKRDQVMKDAKNEKPLRWPNKKTKNFEYISNVYINKEIVDEKALCTGQLS
jgi:putative transposase